MSWWSYHTATSPSTSFHRVPRAMFSTLGAWRRIWAWSGLVCTCKIWKASGRAKMLRCVGVSRESVLSNVTGLSFVPEIACKSARLALRSLSRTLRDPVWFSRGFADCKSLLKLLFSRILSTFLVLANSFVSLLTRVFHFGAQSVFVDDQATF